MLLSDSSRQDKVAISVDEQMRRDGMSVHQFLVLNCPLSNFDIFMGFDWLGHSGHSDTVE